METFRQTVPSPLPLKYFLGIDAEAGIEGLVLDDLNPFQACEQGSFTHVSAFLLGGVDPNTSTMRGVTLLHSAAKFGQALIVRFLIDNGALVDPTDNDGMTPLMYACAAGQPESIKMLIEARADPNLRCRYGHSCYHYAAPHHIAMHFLNFVAPISKDLIEEEELLHVVSATEGSRFSVFYLIEHLGADVNFRSKKGNGGTALHAAALTGDIDLVKALVSKGADPTITDSTGVRASAQAKCPAHVSKWLKKYLAEPSVSRRQQLTTPDFGNWRNITLTEMRNTSFYFSLHYLIVIASFISPLVTFIAFVGVWSRIMSVASFAMKQKNRSIVTAGFFFGGLLIGLVEYVRVVGPVFDGDHPDSYLSWFALSAMALGIYSYIRTVLADPGCVQSTAEQRKDFYAICHRPSELDQFDHTAMVRKPLRSKHCSKTHQCVKRFDHYCVWTANAIGGGNHRFFLTFTTSFAIAHILFSRAVFYYLFQGGSSSRQLLPGAPMSNAGEVFSFMFSKENILVTYFGIAYNLFSLLFNGTMAATHWYMLFRNVTSNENWFPQRYSWMFKIGKDAYSLFDEGKWNNFKSFWFGDLLAEVYTNPKMSDRLKKIVNAYSEGIKKSQAAASCGDAACNEPHPPTSYEQAALASAPPLTQETTITIEQIPQNKKLEVQVIQMLFTQLLQGSLDPKPPADVALTQDRINVCMNQAQNMLSKYRERLNAGKRQGESVATVATPLEDRKRN